MRCIALADALRGAGAGVRFVSRHMPDYLRSLIEGKGHGFSPLGATHDNPVLGDLDHSHWLGVSQNTDAEQTARALADVEWEWLVVDHYAIDRRWEMLLRKSARRLMVIDDLADRGHDCDVLVDNTPNFESARRYSGKVPQHCSTLLGSRYALLREEIHRLRGKVKPRNGEVERVLVFFGGVDAANHTLKAIEALARSRTDPIHVDVVLGRQHPDKEQVQNACNAYQFHCHTQPPQFAELMALADFAIGAGGMAAWERCCLGVPSLVFCVADNQRGGIFNAGLQGLLYAPAISAGVALKTHLQALLDNPTLLQALSKNGMQAVDGLGVHRVVSCMGYTNVTVRPAAHADSEAIYAWRNAPSIRRHSANSDPIDRTAHDGWFSSVVSDPDRILLIGERASEAIGVVRFDIRGSRATVSIYLAPEREGSGLASGLLIAGERWLLRRRPDLQEIEAVVLKDNDRSQRLFENCGYNVASRIYVKGISGV